MDNGLISVSRLQQRQFLSQTKTLCEINLAPNKAFPENEPIKHAALPSECFIKHSRIYYFNLQKS